MCVILNEFCEKILVLIVAYLHICTVFYLPIFRRIEGEVDSTSPPRSYGNEKAWLNELSFSLFQIFLFANRKDRENERMKKRV